MTFKQRAAIAAVALLLSSCGGSEGSGSGSTTVPPVAVIPIPTPTPTPTPSPSYATYEDPLADWRVGPPFLLVQATANRGSLVYSNVKVSIQSADIVEAAFSGRPSITANFADFTRGHFETFTTADVSAENERNVFLQTSDHEPNAIDQWILGRWQVAVDSDYFQYCGMVLVDYSYGNDFGLSGNYSKLSYTFVVGSKTLGSDMPTPMSETVYASAISTVAYGQNISSYAFGNLTLSKTGTLSGKLTDRIDGSYVAEITGSMDQQTHRISGAITAVNGTYAGKFEGHLYGPKGKELGLIVHMQSPDGTFAAGTIFGRRVYSPPPL